MCVQEESSVHQPLSPLLFSPGVMGYSTKFIRGGSAPRSGPFPAFLYTNLTGKERYLFRMPLIEKKVLL